MEFPFLDKIYLKYRDRGLSAVGINIQGDKDGLVEEWVKQKGWSIPPLIGTDLSKLRLIYPITGAPETFLLDSEGKSYFHHVGYGDGQERVVEAEIRLLLGLDPFASD